MNQADLKKALADLLREMDVSREPTTEFRMGDRIRELLHSHPVDHPPLEWKAEDYAFHFIEDCAEKDDAWGTYFGPVGVSPLRDGSVSEYPDLSMIDDQMLEYWIKRAEESSHPLLRARYYGLVWDLLRIVTGRAPSRDIGIHYVTSLLDVARQQLDRYNSQIVRKLGRALEVALSMKADELVSECVSAIQEFERQVAEDGKPGLWGFSFDLLVDDKRVHLSDAEEQEIISELEGRLERLSTRTKDKVADPWSAEHAAERLARYYRRCNQMDDVKRVLGQFERAVEYVAEEADGLLSYALFERVHARYLEFSLPREAEAVGITIRGLGAKINADMREVSHRVEIPRDELEAYLDGITQGGLTTAVARIAWEFTPKLEESRKQLMEYAKQLPFEYRIARQLTDQKGRVVSTVGPIGEDLEGQLAQHMSRTMSMTAVFLSAVLVRLVARYAVTAEALTNAMSESPLFGKERQQIISRGLESYLNEDYVVAVHLLIPQIEHAIREMVELAGGSVLKPRRGGGFHLKNLDELLRDTIVAKCIGDDMVTYLRVLLSDQRGWNLRNDLCHGIFPSEAFVRPMADRLLHVLFCLSFVRCKPEDS